MSRYLGEVCCSDLFCSQPTIHALLGPTSSVDETPECIGKHTQEAQCFCRRLSISFLLRVSPSLLSAYDPSFSGGNKVSLPIVYSSTTLAGVASKIEGVIQGSSTNQPPRFTPRIFSLELHAPPRLTGLMCPVGAPSASEESSAAAVRREAEILKKVIVYEKNLVLNQMTGHSKNRIKHPGRFGTESFNIHQVQHQDEGRSFIL